MPWYDQLRDGSFRGVPFKIRGHEREGGRNTVVHEYPYRALPYVEDLGARAKRFALEVYVLGRDYFAARDALLQAFEEEGSGELVHPFLGTLTVTVLEARMREDAAEGGIARFQVVFIESGAPTAPETVKSSATAVDAPAKAVHAAAAAAFEDLVVTQGVPAFVPQAAASTWEKFVAVFAAFDLKGKTQTVSTWKAKLEGLSDNVLDQLAKPGTFAKGVQDLVRDVSGAAGSRLEALKLLTGLYEVTPSSSSSLSKLGKLADAHSAGMVELVRSAAIAESVRLASGAPWPSYEDAVNARDAIAARLDEVNDTASDDLFRALLDLLAELTEAVPPDGENLPRLGTFTPKATLPSLVLAYRLYDDVGRELELVARNKIPNPGFLLAGVELDVLIDAV